MRLQKLLGTRLSFATGLLVATLVGTATIGLLHTQRAFAVVPQNGDEIKNGTFVFIDRATIEATIGGNKYTFVDNNLGTGPNGNSVDNSANYKVNNSECPGEINFTPDLVDPNDPNAGPRLENFLRDGAVQGAIKMQFKLNGSGTCGPTRPDENIKIGVAPGGMGTWYVRQDANTIVRADGKETYAKDPSGELYFRTSESKCKDLILVDNGNMVLRRLDDSSSFGTDVSKLFGDDPRGLAIKSSQAGCDVKNDDAIGGGSIALGTQPNNPNAGNAGGPSGGSAAEEAPSCENRSAWSLNWLICPLLEGIDSTIDKLDKSIEGLLAFDARFYDENASEGAAKLKNSWSNINRLATYFLLAAGLIMVISTALGFSFVDAYTLRKMLPRIIIAAIGMQLSWYLMRFFIAAVNDIGHGIADLLYAPFGGEKAVGFDIALQKVSPASQGLEGNIIFVGIVIGAFGAAWLLGILSLAATALGIIIVAFLILLIRRIVISALILLAPIAIVSSIMPNTDGFWKFWRKAFVDILILFPLVMVVIAGGKIISYIGAVAPDSAGSLGDIVQIGTVLFGHFGPLAAIPFVAARIGGLVGNLTGMVNNRSKGFFDKQKQRRAQTYKTRLGRAQTDNIFSANTQGKRFFDKDAEGKRIYSLKTFNPLSGAKGMGARRITGAYDVATNNPATNLKLRAGKRAQWILNKTGAAESDPAKRNLAQKAFYGSMSGIANSAGDTRSSITRTRLQHVQKMAQALNNMGNDRALDATRISGGDIGKLEQLAFEMTQPDPSGKFDDNDLIGATQIRDNIIPFLKKSHEDPEMGRANVTAAAGLAYAGHGFISPGKLEHMVKTVAEDDPAMAQSLRTAAELAGRSAGAVGLRPGSSMTSRIETEGKNKGKTVFEALDNVYEIDPNTGKEVRDWNAQENRYVKRELTGDAYVKGAKGQAALAKKLTVGEIAKAKSLDDVQAGYRWIIDDASKNPGDASKAADRDRVLQILNTSRGRFGGSNPTIVKEIDRIFERSGVNASQIRQLTDQEIAEDEKAAAAEGFGGAAQPQLPFEPPEDGGNH